VARAKRHHRLLDGFPGSLQVVDPGQLSLDLSVDVGEDRLPHAFVPTHIGIYTSLNFACTSLEVS
jgi:hypothetical protein